MKEKFEEGSEAPEEPFPVELKCQNAVFGILFLIALLAALGLGAWAWRSNVQDIQQWLGYADDFQHIPNITVLNATDLFKKFRIDFIDNANISLSRYGRMWTAFQPEIVQVFGWVGLAVVCDAFVWLAVIRFFAKEIIWFGIIVGLVFSVIIAVANIAVVVSLAAGVVIIVLVLIKILFYVIFRKEITFAALITGTSLASVSARPSLLLISFLGILVQSIVSAAMLGAVIHWRSGNVLTYVVVFLTYWTYDGIRAITHVACCGVVGHWYFYDPKGGGRRRFPALSSLGQALTKSFGAAALGSLILAAIKWLKYLVEKSKKTKNPCVKGCLICFLICMRHAFDVFNTYAFVFVAVYGHGYLEAGKRTAALVKRRGLSAAIGHVIVEDLQETGVVVGAVCALGLALVLGFFAYELPWQVVLPMAALCLFFGGGIMLVVTCLLDSTMATLFILFAIDPQAMKETKPELHAPLDHAWQGVLEEKRKRKELIAKAKNLLCGCCQPESSHTTTQVQPIVTPAGPTPTSPVVYPTSQPPQVPPPPPQQQQPQQQPVYSYQQPAGNAYQYQV